MTVAPPVAVTPIEALLLSILAAITENTAAVRELGRSVPTKTLSRADLLPALAATVADKAFSAREVIQHAALVDGPLRAALAAAGIVNPRALGKWFRSIEGRAIAGVRLERIGEDHHGIIWRVWECETHTLIESLDSPRGSARN